MADFLSTNVDTNILTNAVSYIDNEINALVSVNTILQNNVLPTLSSVWQGVAKDAFEAQYNLFLPALKAFIQSHKDLNELLKQSATTYDGADNTVKQAVAGLPM